MLTEASRYGSGIIWPPVQWHIVERDEGKYLVQTRSQAKSCGITLPEVHHMDKGINQNIGPEKQVMKPIIMSEAKCVPQIKPRLGQGRAGIKQKTSKFSVSPPLDKTHYTDRRKTNFTTTSKYYSAKNNIKSFSSRKSLTSW